MAPEQHVICSGLCAWIDTEGNETPFHFQFGYFSTLSWVGLKIIGDRENDDMKMLFVEIEFATIFINNWNGK